MYRSVDDEDKCYECGGYACASWCALNPDSYADHNYDDEDEYERG